MMNPEGNTTLSDHTEPGGTAPPERDDTAGSGWKSGSQLFSAMVDQALAENASAIHLEKLQDGVRVRLRMDGALSEVFSGPVGIGEGLIRAARARANLNGPPATPQEGRFTATSLDGQALEMLVHQMPHRWGESIVIRIIDPRSFEWTWEQEGLHNLPGADRLVDRHRGLILFWDQRDPAN